MDEHRGGQWDVSNDDPWGYGQQAGGSPDPASPGSGRYPFVGSASFTGPGNDPLGPPASAIPAVAPIRPPILWLGLSAAAGLVGGFVGWFFGVRLVPALLGWLLAGPVAIGLLARYIWRDTVRRAQPTRTDYGWTGPAYYACAVLAILATALAAYEIALWFGRGGGPVL